MSASETRLRRPTARFSPILVAPHCPEGTIGSPTTIESASAWERLAQGGGPAGKPNCRFGREPWAPLKVDSERAPVARLPEPLCHPAGPKGRSPWSAALIKSPDAPTWRRDRPAATREVMPQIPWLKQRKL